MSSPGIPVKQNWLFPAVVLLALALIAFAPVIFGGGFFWDDIDLLIVNNRLIHSPGGLFDFWFSKKNIDYFPLTSTTFWLEWRMWGTWASPYHLLNALLHGGSGILLWRCLLRLRVPGAMLGAILFVIDPVNAESVAWISERKNTLSMFFMLASLLAYLRALDDKSARWHRAAVLLFLLALLAKTAVVMFPFVLLILAWYRSRRITRADLLHALPFFALSLLLGIVTMIFQKENAIGAHIVRSDPFAARLATAGCAVWFYLFKLLLPVNIIFNYPRWDIGAWGIAGFLPLAALLLVFALLFYRRNRGTRSLLAALGIYVVMLLPILGFIDIFFMRYSYVSDHWQYQASPAILACVAAGAAWIYRKVGGLGGAGGIWALRRRVAAICGGAVCVALLSYTFYIAWIYRTPETIWENTLAHNPQSWLADAQLGKEFQNKGRFDDAVAQFTKATRLVPDDPDIRESLGGALLEDGQPETALKILDDLSARLPNRATVYNSIGTVYDIMHQPEKARENYMEAIRKDPSYAVPHFNLGNLLMVQKQFAAASKEFATALLLDPDYAEAAFYLGGCLASEGRMADAIPYLEEAVRLRPDWQLAKDALAGTVAANQGR